MNFREKISNYVLGNIPIGKLPEIGVVGLEENLESESLVILAGMNEKNNSFEIEDYYKKAMVELGFSVPNKLEAAKILTHYYLKEMISNPSDVFQLMTKIDNEIYKQVDWSLYRKDKAKYIGEEIGLDRLYTWYREIQDWQEGGRLQYYNDLPRYKQREKFEEHIIEESKELLRK